MRGRHTLFRDAHPFCVDCVIMMSQIRLQRHTGSPSSGVRVPPRLIIWMTDGHVISSTLFPPFHGVIWLLMVF